MTTLVISGGELITPQEHRFGNLWIDGSSIEDIREGLPAKDFKGTIVDASRCYVTPGLFDLQVNGDAECDLWADPGESELNSLRMNLARAGVTSFLATLITDDVVRMKRNIAFLCRNGAGAAALNGSGRQALSRLVGIHLEGPCLSPERHGVHPARWLKPLSEELMKELIAPAVSLVTLAPELEPAGQAVSFLRHHKVQVALGHSNATVEQAKEAFDKDVRLMTHTFNALPPLHHRAAGAIGAAMLDDRVSCCLICDGLHVSPEVSQILIKIKGVEKVILVSDAAHTGTSKGGLVGSSIKLSQAVRNVVNWGGATFAQAVRMASWNPALAMGLAQQIGQLSTGKNADVVLWDKQSLEIKQVFIGGQTID